MAYRIYADGWLLHDDRLESYQVTDARLDLELNKTGSFSFSIYPDHVYFSKPAILKTIVEVYQDDELIFRGRIFDEDVGFYNERKFACEGDLAFLLDSIQRPHEYVGNAGDYFRELINTHNSQVEAVKRFAIGNVTITGANTWWQDHVNTWNAIENLLHGAGGYLQTRMQDGAIYIDYLQEIDKLSSQTINFGDNLIDLNKIRKSDGIATALIPLGAKIKDENNQEMDNRLTIEAVNGGLDYIVDAAADAQFGRIFTTAIWDDITDANILLAAGREQLAKVKTGIESIELSAADLSMTGQSVGSFRIGSQVRVISKPHEIDALFLISKQSISLFEPAGNTLTLGGTLSGFSAALQRISGEQGAIYRQIDKAAQNANNAVYNVERNIEASIAIAEQNISQTVSDRFYLKGETDALVSEISSQLEQTAEGFTMRFDRFGADLNDLINGTDAEFELIRKFIRFVDGSILLGEIGNELELKISSNRISFQQGGAEVAFFSNNKLNVTDGQFLNSLQIGNFAFIPRNNGNLSFKKYEAATNANVAGFAAVGSAPVG